MSLKDYQEQTLRSKLESIAGLADRESADYIRMRYIAALRSAARLLPKALAGTIVGDVEYTIQSGDAEWRALEKELHYREFEDALTAEDFSHVSHRSWCGRNQLHVYRRDVDSPTQCLLRTSGDGDDPRIQAIMRRRGKHSVLGGQRGEMACRRALRG